jgi:uncharacterized membrane protein YccC
MGLRDFFASNIVGIHYAVRICIGTTLLWYLTQAMHATSTLWAIISLIIVTEPQMRLAWLAFRSRMLNTFVGAIVGFSVLACASPTSWVLIAAITFTALISTYINRFQQGWRLAPITTALIISAGMTHESAASGMNIAISRTFEVFLGSAVAVAVTVVMARIWLPPTPTAETERK